MMGTGMLGFRNGGSRGSMGGDENLKRMDKNTTTAVMLMYCTGDRLAACPRSVVVELDAMIRSATRCCWRLLVSQGSMGWVLL
jgi:hypothetical protein